MRSFKVPLLFTVMAAMAALTTAQAWSGPAAIGFQVGDRKGRPIAAARVTLELQAPEGKTGPPPVETDAKGRAVVANLAAGTWQAEVSHPDYLSFVAVIDLVAGKKPAVSASFLQAGGTSLTPMKVKIVRGNPSQASPPLMAASTPPTQTQPAPAPVEPAPVQPAPVPASEEPRAAEPSEEVQRDQPVEPEPQPEPEIAEVVIETAPPPAAEPVVPTPVAAEPELDPEPAEARQPAPVEEPEVEMAAAEPEPQVAPPEPVERPVPAMVLPPAHADPEPEPEPVTTTETAPPESDRGVSTAAAPPPPPPAPVEPEVVEVEPELQEVPVAAEEIPSAPAQPEPEVTPVAAEPEVIPVVAPQPEPEVQEVIPEPEELPEPAVPEAQEATPETEEMTTPAVPEVQEASPEPEEIPTPVAPETQEVIPEPQEIPAPPVAPPPAEPEPQSKPEPEGLPVAVEETAVEAPPAEPEISTVPEPVETAAVVEEEAPPPPPAPAPAPPATAPATILPAPPALGPGLVSFRDESCIECKTGEWSVVSTLAVGVATPGSSGACPSGLSEAAQLVAELLGRSTELESLSFAGPALESSTDAALAVAEPDTVAAVQNLLAPFGGSSCGVVAAVLPRAGRFVGFQYGAADDHGGGRCLPEEECEIGQGRWFGSPEIVRGPKATVVYGIFQNLSVGRERRAELSVFFRPPTAFWRPPAER